MLHDQVRRLFLTRALRRVITMVFAIFAATYVVDYRCTIAGTTTGTWTPLTNANPGGPSGTMLLLTDGSVMVQQGGLSSVWYKLTPDGNGNYVKGTWKKLGSMTTPRTFFGSNVLPNGRVFVLGSLSGTGGSTGETYDPVADLWTGGITYPKAFSDGPTVLLPNGMVLCGDIADNGTYLFNSLTNRFTASGAKLRNDTSSGETWTLLPDGSVVSYDVNASPSIGAGTAQRYSSTAGTWSTTGAVPVPLSGASVGHVVGPAMLLPNGNVIVVGTVGTTAIYSPNLNSWAQGPKLPASSGADIAPGAMLPDGHFIFMVDTPAQTGPTLLLDYDYTTNTITNITANLPPALQSILARSATEAFRFLVLPNGHILLNAGNGTIWDYVPTGTPQPTWQPTISNVTAAAGNNPPYNVTGRQLTGISQGTSFGLGAEADTNYPIVRLTNTITNQVYYGKTTNWTPGVATGNVSSSAQFTTPAGIPVGTSQAPQNYYLSVVANGIASPSVNFALPFTPNGPNYNYVHSTYAAGTLTLTGDMGANAVSITERGGILTVQGAGLTKIIDTTLATTAQQFSYPNVPNTLTIVCTFTQGGSDSITMVSVTSASTAITFSSVAQGGNGGNSANLTYCVVTGNPGTLMIDGGAHGTAGAPNTVVLAGTTATGGKTIHNVP